MDSYAWYMVKYADMYRQYKCKHMHQICKHMQAYAFYNNKHANIWYDMQAYAKFMKKNA